MQTKAFLPPLPGFSLKKSERLCSKKAFEFLFAEGTTFFSYPVKVIYSQMPLEEGQSDPLVQVAFGVSKRNFKRAVKRNRIKRLLRESYRRNKLPALPGKNQYLMFMFVSKQLEEFDIVEGAVKKAVNQIQAKIEKNS